MTSTEDYWRSEFYRERNEKLKLLTMVDHLRQHLEDVHGCQCERTSAVVPSIAINERESSSSSDTDDTT